MKRHCHIPAIRAASSQISADTQTLPRSLLTYIPTQLLIILVVWKSLGADKKGSAALQTKMILSNTQQLAITRDYFPTCTKLPFRVKAKAVLPFNCFHFAIYKAPRFQNSLFEFLHSLGNGICNVYRIWLLACLLQSHEYLPKKVKSQLGSVAYLLRSPERELAPAPQIQSLQQNCPHCRNYVTTEKKQLGPSTVISRP